MVEIEKAKIFLYTNENYSHINNKIDLDDHEIFKDIQNFANYMHQKHLKSLEKFREADMKLKEELQDLETLKSIDVEIGGNVYLELSDMYKNSFQKLCDELYDSNNMQELELEGIIYCMEPETFNQIYIHYLDRLEQLAKCMIKKKDTSEKLKQIIAYYKKHKVSYLNMNYRSENPWLFASNCRKDIQNLVFQQHEDIPSPRLHENVLYHNIIMARLEEIIERNTKIFIDHSEDTSTLFLSRNAPLMKMGAIKDTKFEPENIPLTNEIDVIIPHANEINKNKMMRKPTVMQIKNQSEHKEEYDSDLTLREHSHMYNHTQTQNLVFIEQKVDESGKEVEFDQDFIL